MSDLTKAPQGKMPKLDEEQLKSNLQGQLTNRNLTLGTPSEILIDIETESQYAEELAGKIAVLRHNFILNQRASKPHIPKTPNTADSPIEFLYDRFTLLEKVVFGKVHIPDDWRKQELNNLRRTLVESKAEILSYFEEKYGMSHEASLIHEFNIVLDELDYTIANMTSWVQEKHDAPLTFKNASVYSLREPYGIVLIIGSWRNPLISLLKPMISAIAAGNYPVLYPTTRVGRLTQILSSAFKKHLDATKYSVIENEISVEELLKQKFNFVYCTAGLDYCKKVARIAGDRYIPFATDVSGVNIAIIDETVDLNSVIPSLFYSKFTNAGQTPFAPDVVYVSEHIYQDFIYKTRIWFDKTFGTDPLHSKDFSRIFDEEHFKGLQSLMNEQNGGTWETPRLIDEKNRIIGPAIISNAKKDSKLRTSMIRGPIMSVVEFSSLDEVNTVEYERRTAINNVYYFTERRERGKEVIGLYKYSNVYLNDASTQYQNLFLATGSNGDYSYNKLNGRHGFKTFSYARTVQETGDFMLTKKMLPPISRDKYNMINNWKLLQKVKVSHVKLGLIGLGLFAAYKEVTKK
eukprot:CAMPEP_0176446936 /NCGR_PEP_ID=MMETSP0127-20121128/24678_1 /TAXON_ID=938130 /ORGANISM="Platyophrya macrostoma, Strain WH" /LENGTH=574 /DNA_ID=CAMNT_0017833177 /DNA_START=20 /DNA_END=1744 /DNA_ORIENTATION=-